MLFSVIIPVYNDWVRLAKCLNALGRQTLPAQEYELLIVDNGSTNLPNIDLPINARLVHENKAGSYNARNKAIPLARGIFLAFTDADCIPRHDWLEMALAYFESEPDVDMLGGGITLLPFNKDRLTPVEIFEKFNAFPQEQWIQNQGFAATANLFVRRQVVEEIGGFDGRLNSGGDQEFCKRAVSNGFTLRYADHARISHPSRRSFIDYYKKRRRVMAGLRDRALLLRGKSPYTLSVIWLHFRPPIKRCLQMLQASRLESLINKIKLQYAVVIVHYIDFYCVVMAALSTESPR